MSRLALRAGLLAGLLAAGCAHKAAPAAPAEAGAAPATTDEARLADLEFALAGEEDRLRGAGVPIPAMKSKDMSLEAVSRAEGQAAPAQAPATVAAAEVAEESPQRDRGGRRCRQVCDLSTAICDLRSQICGLRDRHPGEARYHDVCERAATDCRVATEACDACD